MNDDKQLSSFRESLPYHFRDEVDEVKTEEVNWVSDALLHDKIRQFQIRTAQLD